VLFVVQIITGFALYSLPYQDGWIKAGFGWVIVLFGAQLVRLVHFLIMFLLIAFTIHHVYSAVLIDIEEKSGLVSSMITGRKSLTARHVAEAGETGSAMRQVRQSPGALNQPGGSQTESGLTT
jgi:Ni/Fe-hydrogenase 1 B-type cytochrome subunit